MRAVLDRGPLAAARAQPRGEPCGPASGALLAPDAAPGRDLSARRRACPRPCPSRSGPARPHAAPRRRVRTRCAPARAARCRTPGRAPRRGARRFGAPGAGARRGAPSRGRGAPCRRPAASRPWPGRRRRPSQGTARTGCARARVGASRTSGTGPFATRSAVRLVVAREVAGPLLLGTRLALAAVGRGRALPAFEA